MDTRSDSNLLCLPLEVRWDIYRYLLDEEIHIFIQAGRLRHTACKGADPLDGKWVPLPSDVEIQETILGGEFPVINATWARRVHSLWGSHWPCEEALEAKEEDGNLAKAPGIYLSMLLVCKQLHFEYADAIADHVVFNILDFVTLERFLGFETRIDSLSSVAQGVLQRLRKLKLQFRLPLEYFGVIERRRPWKYCLEPHRDNIFTDGLQQANNWSTMWGRVWQLPALTDLYVWLDHSDSLYWSVVNERIMLKTLLEHAGRSPSPRLCLDLPEIGTRRMNPNRHIALHELGPGGGQAHQLHRRQRLSYVSGENTFQIEDPTVQLRFYRPDVSTPAWDYASEMLRDETEMTLRYGLIRQYD